MLLGNEKFDGITILDALSASGLRTIRFSKELKDVKKVFANDISEASHKLMMDNFKLNELDLSKIESIEIIHICSLMKPYLLISDFKGCCRVVV